MLRIAKFAVAVVFLLAFSFSFGQTNIGMPPFGTFHSDGTAGTVNLANLNDHFEIPIRSTPGRGFPLIINLTLDTAAWHPSFMSNGTRYWNGPGNGRVSSNADGSLDNQSSTATCPAPPYSQTTVHSNYSFIDGRGTPHYF